MGLLLTSVNLARLGFHVVLMGSIHKISGSFGPRCICWTTEFVVVVTDTVVPYLAINDNIQGKHGINKLLSMERPGGGDVTVCFLFPFWEMCNWI